MAGKEKRVGIILENLAEISEIIVVCESNSVTIKNGNIADWNKCMNREKEEIWKKNVHIMKM